MALVDYEAVVLDLEAEVAAKNSHGQRDLLRKIAELRQEHRVTEGLPERALRLYGAELGEDIETLRSSGSDKQPNGTDHARVGADG